MGVPNCTAHTFSQNVDHFGYDAAVGKYDQRYFTYDGFAESYPTLVALPSSCSSTPETQTTSSSCQQYWAHVGAREKMNVMLSLPSTVTTASPIQQWECLPAEEPTAVFKVFDH